MKQVVYKVKESIEKTVASYKETAELTIAKVTQAGEVSPKIEDVFEQAKE